jgi:hypothetical protein
METFKQIFFLISISIVLVSCGKKEVDLIDIPNDTIPSNQNFTDLHDTLVYVDWANGYNYFNLDIDNDSTVDFILTAFSHYSSSSGSESYYQITPLNEYEIVYSDYVTTIWEWHPDLPDTIFIKDTVMIPKVFAIGDTIFSEGVYTNNPLMIEYSMNPGPLSSPYHSGLNYGIGDIDSYFYCAFRNQNAMNPKLAWLRLKFQYSVQPGIILNSCCYNDIEFYFIIE